MLLLSGKKCITSRLSKELPTGEKYLVDVEIVMDENDMPAEIKDTIIKKLND